MNFRQSPYGGHMSYFDPGILPFSTPVLNSDESLDRMGDNDYLYWGNQPSTKTLDETYKELSITVDQKKSDSNSQSNANSQNKNSITQSVESIKDKLSSVFASSATNSTQNSTKWLMLFAVLVFIVLILKK